MIRAAGLEGPVKMIAVQGQVLSLTEDSVKLRLGVAALATEPNRRVLAEKMSARTGRPFRVVFEVGNVEGTTVADEERRERVDAHRAMVEAFRKDPFVIDVAELFGGTVDEDSIRALQPEDPDSTTNER